MNTFHCEGNFPSLNQEGGCLVLVGFVLKQIHIKYYLAYTSHTLTSGSGCGAGRGLVCWLTCKKNVQLLCYRSDQNQGYLLWVVLFSFWPFIVPPCARTLGFLFLSGKSVWSRMSFWLHRWTSGGNDHDRLQRSAVGETSCHTFYFLRRKEKVLYPRTKYICTQVHVPKCLLSFY